jgi:hypothetical protein
MTRNPEMRLDAIGAQAAAQNNRSFDDIGLNKLGLLVSRSIVKSKRPAARVALAAAKEAADDRKLLLREKKATAHLFRERSQHALRMVEWMVEPHHTDRYIREHPDDVEYSHKSIEQELKEAGNSIKKRKEVLQQNYYCITTGSLV